MKKKREIIKPVVSIVIPAFNEEKYLPKCLESLKKQNFDLPYEIIVVDNNSTDNTAKIAKDNGAKVFFEKNRGVCFARQKGTEKAKGKIIVSTDADCFFPENWLLNIYKAFQKNKKAVAIVGPCDYERKPWWGRIWIRTVFTLVWIFYRLTGKIFYASAVNFAFLKKTWKEVGGYNVNLTQGGDEYYLLRKIKKEGKVIFLKDNKILTSSRRLYKGLFYNFFITLIFYYFFDYLIASRILGKSFTGSYPAVRDERKEKKFLFKKRFILGLIFLFLLFYYLFFSPTSQAFGKVIFKINTKQRIIALTFDDGPNEPYTSEILDTLKEYNIKATFFEVGKNIEKHPKTTERIFKEGHIIGNHTYSHSIKKPLFHPFLEDEISRNQDIIYKITGKKPTLFRPPWLFREPFIQKTLRKKNLIMITGTFGSNFEVFQPKYDYRKIANDAIKKVKPGAILIFHDGYNTKGGYREDTVKALRIIIEELLKRGYKFVTVPELLKISAYQN